MDIPTGFGERSTYHPAEKHAPRDQRIPQGHRMGATAGAQGLYNYRALQKRDRAGGDYHPTCHHQGGESQEMKLLRGGVTFRLVIEYLATLFT